MSKGYLRPAVCLLCAVAVATGCASEAIKKLPPAPAEAAVASGPQEYHIRQGDQLAIRFFYTPELNQDVVVRPDGKISVLLLDDVPAVGKTVAELDQLLTARYAKELRQPDLTVSLLSAAPAKAYVGGEVEHPRLIEFTEPITVTQAIFMAGGAKETAKLDQVVVIRSNEGLPQPFVVNVKNVLTKGEGDVVLQPCDTIYLPRKPIADVGLFVKQYIDSIVPRNLLFSFYYDVDRRRP